jgi:hypothetical protein
MIRLAVRLAAITLALLVAACAAGPQFSGVAAPARDQGDVYLYRGSDVFAAAQSFDVTLDGKDAGKLYNASFVHLRLPAGSYVLTVAPGGGATPRSITIRPEMGKALFFQFAFHYERNLLPLGNASFPNASIQPRATATALEDLKELKSAK